MICWLTLRWKNDREGKCDLYMKSTRYENVEMIEQTDKQFKKNNEAQMHLGI
jgi:hypothetical protein